MEHFIKLIMYQWCRFSYNSRFTLFYWFSKPTLYIVGCVSADSSIHPLLSRNIRIAIFRARRLFLFFLSAMSNDVSTPPCSRMFFAYSRNAQLSRSNNCNHAFDSSMFPVIQRERRQKKKNGPWVCDISWSPSRPRPTVLLNPRPFLALIPHLFPPCPSFLSSSCPSHVNLDFVSLCRILHPTDHSYVAFSASPDSYEIAEALVVNASEY